MKLAPVVVSRVDRMGDLILSFPSLSFLGQHHFRERVLHCSSYCQDLGEWALYNGLCEDLWIAGTPYSGPLLKTLDEARLLCLFHSRLARKDFKRYRWSGSLGPRSHLSSLWTYSRSIAQHRSRVEKSEMSYNLDLVRAFLEDFPSVTQDFRGLPALKVPPSWPEEQEATDVVVVLSNRGSALNWPVSQYIQVAQNHLRNGLRVDFLVNGIDAVERLSELRAHSISQSEGVRVLESFTSVKSLIRYLSCARLVVSSSTGPLHIAHAAGVEVLGIYPRVRVQSFERWRPHGYWHKAPLRFVEIGQHESQLIVGK